MKHIIILLVIFSSGLLTAAPLPKSRAHASRIYRKAFIDVEDDGHFTKKGRKKCGDVAHVRSFIWSELHDYGIGIALSDEEKQNPDLHVICRFKHGFGKPMVTPGFQINVRYINQCTLRIVDKKSQKTLLDKTYIRNNTKVNDFIKQAFSEWQKQPKK